MANRSRSLVMALDLVHVVNEYEMQTQIAPPTVDEMVDFISTQINELDPRRRYMFIEWLCAHTNCVKCVFSLREGMNMWFDSIPAECAVREYRTITNEIGWWQRQDANVLDRLILDHLQRHK